MPRGGKRPNAGRKKGHKEPHTLELDRIQREFKQRVARAADRLFMAQMLAAEGCTMLFRRPKAGGRFVKVTDEATIQAYLDGEFSDPESPDYYFMTTERPNADAADRLLNRALGKATERHEVSGPDGGPVRAIFEEVLAP